MIMLNHNLRIFIRVAEIGGKVRIASMPILTSVILSEVFYRFHKLYPYVSIELIEGSSMDIRKAIEEHQVDFGIKCRHYPYRGK